MIKTTREPAELNPGEVVDTSWGKTYRVIETVGKGGLAYIYAVEEVGAELPDDCTQEVQDTRYALKVWKQNEVDPEILRIYVGSHKLLQGLPEDPERVTVHEIDPERFMALLSLIKPYKQKDSQGPISDGKKLYEVLRFASRTERLLHAAKLLEHIFCIRRWSRDEGIHIHDLKEGNLIPMGQETVLFKGKTYHIPRVMVRTDFDFVYSADTLDALFVKGLLRGTMLYFSPEQVQKGNAWGMAHHYIDNPTDLDELRALLSNMTPVEFEQMRHENNIQHHISLDMLRMRIANYERIQTDYRMCIFALGISLYHFLTGEKLWAHFTGREILRMLSCNAEVQAEVKRSLKNIKRECKAFVTEANEQELMIMLINMIGDMLSPEPQERDKVFHAIKAFQHKLQFVADLPAAA